MAPLTQTQLGIYLETSQSEGAQLYHNPWLIKLDGVSDSDLLAEAVAKAIAAHPGISARIVTDGDGIPGWAEGEQIAVERKSLPETELLETKQTLVTPFELDGGPLSRVMVIETDGGNYLFVDFHHTLFDGGSFRVFLEDIGAAYAGEKIPDERISLFSQAAREVEVRATPALTQAADAYRILLGGAETGFDMLPDKSESDGAYSTLRISLDIDGDDYLTWCRHNDMPQSVPATSVAGLLLREYYRRDDLTFATIYHGRKTDDVARTFTMMVKTLPVRVNATASATVGELLADVKANLAVARDNDIYSFAEAARDHGVNSDFLFAYQGDYLNLPDIAGKIEAQELEAPHTGSKISFELSIKEGKLYATVQYNADLYSEKYIRTFVGCYANLLSEVMVAPADATLSSLRILSETENEFILKLSDGGDTKADLTRTIPSLFKQSATAHPDNIAVVFNDVRLTYRELDELTDRLATRLREEYGVAEGTRVGVMIERSALMAVFPLAVMKAGGAYMPLDPHFPSERLEFMVGDAAVNVILADDGLVDEKLPDFAGNVFEASSLQALTEEVSPLCHATPDSPMVVLYTSGSTGKPKGVTLTQRNLVNFCAAYQELTAMRSTDRVGAYASFGFDAHMMDFYPTLLSGATVYIFNAEIRLDLTAMHDYVENSRITVMFMTTQIAWQMATLFDFSTLRVMGCGGEKLPPFTPKNYEFFNVYGPTECSVIATAYHVTGPTDGRIIGRPIPGYETRIVDTSMRLLPPGVNGELIIMGDSVGEGYLNRSDLTAEKFITLDGKRAYRTGDQARWTSEGEIEFLGRMDGLVKLRGLRIELGEIEAVATAHPAVRTFVAAVKDLGGMENLVGYYTVREGENVEPDELRAFMSESLTEFMLPLVIMKLDAMPMTPNGKVDRRALPLPEVELTEIVAPETEAEKKLFDIAASVLSHSDFGVTTNLVSVGLTSLMTMRLVASIMKETGVRLTAKSVMSAPTIREIAAAMASAATSEPQVKPAHVSRRYYPLTENQRGLYIDWEMNRDALQYNIPQAFKLAPGTDAEQLREAVRTVIKAHPGLLTRLALRGNDIVQVAVRDVAEAADNLEIEITELDAAPDAEFFQSRVKPFDLLGEQLFRCEIFRHGDDVYMLRDTHHIIFDGVSAMVFQQDLAKALDGDSLEKEEYTALDRSLDEKEMLESDMADKARSWFDELIGESEPTSYPRSVRPDGDAAGAMGRIKISVESRDIRKFCATNGITPSNFMLSSFLQLLHRLTREKTVQITTVNNGRADVRLISDTGMFVKTLPVVSRVETPDMSPREFAESVQTQFLTSQDYDFYPFTDLVERKGVRPEIMYVFEGGIDMAGDERISTVELSLDTAKVPLTVLVFEPSDSEYELVAEYDKSMYSEEDMRLLLEMLRTLTLSLPEVRTVADGRMVSDEQERELEKIRRGEVHEIPYQSMHGAMEQRVDENPGAPALVASDKSLTYGEFDRECNRIANALIKRGVKHGDRLVILLPRTSSLITAIYGAMKTGSAYIPCDPEYPAERIRLITRDSGARYVITTRDHMAQFPGQAVCIDDLLEETNDTRPGVEVGPEDVAYMIYTSGSTGVPKGVMIPQRAISNYLYAYWHMNYRTRQEIKTEMLIVTISFDASLNNLGVSLTSGHCLVLADEEACKDAVILSRLMLDNSVDTSDFTPSRLDAMLDLPEFREAVSRMGHINIGGEGIPDALVEKLFATGFKGVCVNEYGPTETTVGSNRGVLLPGSPVTAGVPLYNLSQRIVDGWGGELPVGAVGELFIFGRSLGLGYNNLPDKTAAAYVDFKGDRAYRTGDLARWTPDGDVVILGRIDHQVKLRGLRIELGEIESVAQKFDGISKVVAAVREVNNIQHLCLYYTTSAPVDKVSLHKHLARTLTEYMVPDALTEVAEMPLTPNGKINRKALPEPEIAPLIPYVEPEGELEAAIAKAYEQILHRDRVGANDDFFGIGGTSISAIKVVASLAAAGHNVTYKNVFNLRTPRALADFIECKPAAAEDRTVAVNEERNVVKSEFAELLDDNNLSSYLHGDAQPVGDVLLTGATGFMGIHILHELLMRSDQRVLCLLRSKGGIAPASRLRTLLFYYFDNTFEDAFESGRLCVVEGDVTGEMPTQVKEWGVKTVVNCAANVKHFSAGNDIETVNVESVRHLIVFCLEAGARLVHVSTISVAGESVNGYPDPSIMLTERMLDFGQSLANQYVHSKYESERLVLTAIRDRGLNAKIMRVGNLSARSSDGEFQVNFRSNAFMGTLRAYVALGCAPYAVLDAPCEFSPIDEVCRAILLLATTPRSMTVFQPCNNHRLPMGDVLHILGEIGHEVKPVETDEFMARRATLMENPDKVEALQPLMAYDSDEASKSTFIRYDASFTNQILYRLGFRWNYTSHAYVERFLKAIDGLNFFAV